MLQDHCVYCWQKKRGGFGLIYYVSNSINLRELLGGACLSWNMFYNLPAICHVEKKQVTVFRNSEKNHETLSIIRHVGFHVNFSSMKSSLDL